ncbi:type II toxin-antitoxin system Phd/YefM family antitoxin [Caulobacter segnis]|uniref:Type II toxin-antitoxin system prevent-host-death family antitoxin n=1 Tax=Caulobacter segnis TaxID=88688 RepID=A0A2W5X764_9CAUL|nr:type II toxin-antitoxin system prevent-host-death family antitoxin [Caulobacter segnis]PZR32701.1 MAG: type II toxin-antitoxin system prevent-host-death family antitoxin [Caulobacter segnis]
MRVAVAEAEGQLTDLVRRAEAGEEIILTQDGHAAVKLTPIPNKPLVDSAERMRRLQAISESGRAKATPGVSAARSQDFLYDDDGLPG